MSPNSGLPSKIALYTACALTASAATAQQARTGEVQYPDNKIPETVYVYGIQGGYTAENSISATKTDTRLIDIPQSVSVITRDLIDDQAMTSLGDLARYVPGVSMAQGEGHRDAPVLRSNVTTGDMFVDGVRDDLQYFRDLYALERVEVLKGASGMIFGRSAGGGIVNRVMKQADGETRQAFNLTTGSYDAFRVAGDIGGRLGSADALVSVMYEDSDSYRDEMQTRRFGLRPTVAFDLGESTRLDFAYERFEDDRVVDRGVPSLDGRPLDIGREAYFGNPDLSYSEIAVNSFTARISHRFSDNLTFTNTTLYGDYEKFYQNAYAGGAVVQDLAPVSAYNSGTDRTNVFNQTDLVWNTAIGNQAHKVLFGFEAGNQESHNTRVQGRFPGNNNATGQNFSLSDRGRNATVLFNNTQQDNTPQLDLAAFYFQDQISLTDEVLVLLGARYDSFDLNFDNHIGSDFSRKDSFVSPRAGIIWKPADTTSLYTSYSRSFLPQSGDQFSSLNATTSTTEPERFETMEIGAKWELGPELMLSAALYRIDRERTLSPGPIAGTVVQTGAQRTNGVELSMTGELVDGWDLIAAYGWQDAVITETTSSAPEGRKVALVPEHTLSFWSKVEVHQDLSVGVGASWQDESYTSFSNSVLLPSFTRVDAAVFYTVADNIELQLNVENLFNKKYWATAHNDNNITPGAPIMMRLRLNAYF